MTQFKELIDDHNSGLYSFAIIVVILIGMLVAISIADFMSITSINYNYNYKVACERIENDGIPVRWLDDVSCPCEIDYDNDGFERGSVRIDFMCAKFGSRWTKYCNNDISLLDFDMIR